MFRLILLVTICFAGAATAQITPMCQANEPGQDCDQILACIGSKGQWFNGTTLGRGPVNDIEGQMNNGTICTGQRTQFNKAFSGSITLTCSDGTQTTVKYDPPLLGEHRDFGRGHDVTPDGRDINIWVSQDLISTLRRESGGIVSLLPCPGGAIRLD